MSVWLGTLLTSFAASVFANSLAPWLGAHLTWWQTAFVALGAALLALPFFFWLQKNQQSRRARQAQIAQKITSSGKISTGDTSITGEDLEKASIKQKLKGSEVNVGNTSINSKK